MRWIILAPAPSLPPLAQPVGTPEFAFKGQKMRVVQIEGEPWFVAKDVCLTLGMKQHPNGGYSHLLYKFAAGVEKQNILRSNRDHNPDLWSDEATSTRVLSIISESGLYKLIMRSDKPEAKGFQDWVTREVLPTIRKTGAYGSRLCRASLEVWTCEVFGGGPKLVGMVGRNALAADLKTARNYLI